MTIDEAIKHCLDVAKEQTYQADAADAVAILDGLDVDACRQCADDHRQLAEWLQELIELRDDVDKLRDIILQIFSETTVATFRYAHVTLAAIDKILDESSSIWNRL